jgi:8-oxo-dGTP pyrophosphatase MutT (NUDIX family)
MPSNPHQPWKTLSKKTVLHYPHFLTVEEHAVQLPDGQVIPDWTWVIIPDAAIILVETREGKFLVFRQVKYALEGISLAPVAGMLEKGEDPLDGAKRELREETGYAASTWVHLGSFCLEPNRGVCTDHLFLARGAYPVAEPVSDDLEQQEILFLDRNEIEKALIQGEFKALEWTTVVSLGLQYLTQTPG